MGKMAVLLLRRLLHRWRVRDVCSRGGGVSASVGTGWWRVVEGTMLLMLLLFSASTVAASCTVGIITG